MRRVSARRTAESLKLREITMHGGGLIGIDQQGCRWLFTKSRWVRLVLASVEARHRKRVLKSYAGFDPTESPHA